MAGRAKVTAVAEPKGKKGPGDVHVLAPVVAQVDTVSTPGVFGDGPHALVAKSRLDGVASPFPTNPDYVTGQAEVAQRVAENA